MQPTPFRTCATLCAAALLFNATLLGHGDDHEGPIYVLDDYVVSAGPTARSINDFASPFSALDESDIQRGNASTLGDLLNTQPGVSATSFGGGASRPIIRGFDGPRVRIVESGLGSQDVSETSPDHAVSVEPLLTERVEILRGPATLLYGSSAIGGVVNTVGREYAREQPTQTLTGGLEARYDTVSEGETYLGYATVSEGPLAVTFQALRREADNYEIPVDAELYAEHDDHDEDHGDDDHGDGGHDEDEHHDEEHGGDELESSFAESDFYSAGVSWFFGERNYLAASISRYESFYGVPGHEHEDDDEHADDEHADDDDHADDDEHEHEHGEEGVVIDMERTRFDTELALFEPFNWIEAIRVRFGYTDYEHQEFEGDEVGTTFKRKGWELRTEASHYDWLVFDEGVFGVQVSDTDFEAVGEEIQSDDGGFAFGPPSNTQSQAFFLSEHIHRDNWHYEFGARVERQTIDVDGFSDYDDVALSLAISAIWEFDETNSIAVSLQRTQRHPNATELYANGPHVATRTFEVGDEDLDLETAYGVDLSYCHRSDDWEGTFSVFYTYFDDYIFAEEQAGMEEAGFPVFNYKAVEANFYGFEAELNYIAYRSGDTLVRLGLLADYVFAENSDDNEDLPRIPPFRLGGKAELEHGNWFAGLMLRHSFEQNNNRPLETETDGFTELEAGLGYAFDLGNGLLLTTFVRASNLLDEEIRHHTSYIKDEAPRPGRNFTLGARLEF